MLHRENVRGARRVDVKLMTFNLRRHKESDGKNDWNRRRDAVAAIVQEHAPDLLGTQEGLHQQVHYVLDKLDGYATIGEARFGGRRDEYNAIFYRKDRFRVRAHGNFWLSDTPNEAGSRSWGNLVPRMATWATFEDKDTGGLFHHVNTHLDHLIPSARLKGARLIASRLPGDLPVVMTGDFNALQTGGTYRFLTNARGAGLIDSRRFCQDHVEDRWNATFHKFTGRGLYRIDYLLGRGIRSFRNHRVIRDKVDGQVPSDHFPVLADVSFDACLQAAVRAARAAHKVAA